MREKGQSAKWFLAARKDNFLGQLVPGSACTGQAQIAWPCPLLSHMRLCLSQYSAALTPLLQHVSSSDLILDLFKLDQGGGAGCSHNLLFVWGVGQPTPASANELLSLSGRL